MTVCRALECVEINGCKKTAGITQLYYNLYQGGKWVSKRRTKNCDI